VTGSSPDYALADTPADPSAASIEAGRRQREALAALYHDLRTPLGTIIGFAEVLTASDIEVDEATRQEFLRDILAAARRLQATLERAQSA
jgi:K+-sensing histidine kinase KdpD